VRCAWGSLRASRGAAAPLLERAEALGFTAEQLAPLRDACDPASATYRAARARAAQGLRELERELAEAVDARGLLRAALVRWDRWLRKRVGRGTAPRSRTIG
jgi:hypothetical protein